MASPALIAFFESLATELDINKLTAAREQENIHLEFKQKKVRNEPDLADSDKWQFSRALSGFANSDGGVLIWGIVTDNEERAASLAPITGCREFQARLKKSLLNAVQPVVDNVRIEVIPTAENSEIGFVTCLVPASDKAPHRAMLANREYYKRSTEGFYRLEHFDLEDMFGRRPVPRLELSLKLVQRGSSGGGGYTKYMGLAVATITNVGRGSARAPYLGLKVSPKYSFSRSGIDGNGNEGLPRRTTTSPDRLVFTSYDVVIHPGLSHEVTGIEIYADADHKMRVVVPPDLVLEYELSAENARLQTGELRVSGREIADTVVPGLRGRAV
jgi:schlafen family protein